MDELCSKSASELASMIRSGTTTSTAVVEAHLARIDEVNPHINSVRVILADSALSAAKAVDRTVADGGPLGPLAGVPFTVKENIDVEGSATTWGVAAFAEQIAGSDAPVVARLREAGGIPLARTNLPDFALRWDTASGIGGRTLNPWDPARTPGGSSGGEAAALATGMTPLGLGNDLGGSLRIPAQYCGIASMRPSRGRVAHSAVTQPWPEPLSIQMASCQGPMARHIGDLRLALGLLSARDVRDPQWVPAPLTSPPLDGPIRVAVVRDPAGAGIDPHVRAGIDRSADWLSDAGYDVVDADPPQILETTRAWYDAIWADLGLIWPGMEAVACPEAVEFVAACLAEGVFHPVDQGGALAVWSQLRELAAAWSQFSAENPVILSPVSCERPWPIGEDLTRTAAIAESMRMVLPINILGLPSCAVPVGSDDGLPQGVQLIGARFTEDILLDAAQTLEDHAPVLTPVQPKVAA